MAKKGEKVSKVALAKAAKDAEEKAKKKKEETSSDSSSSDVRARLPRRFAACTVHARTCACSPPALDLTSTRMLRITTGLKLIFGIFFFLLLVRL